MTWFIDRLVHLCKGPAAEKPGRLPTCFRRAILLSKIAADPDLPSCADRAWGGGRTVGVGSGRSQDVPELVAEAGAGRVEAVPARAALAGAPAAGAVQAVGGGAG